MTKVKAIFLIVLSAVACSRKSIHQEEGDTPLVKHVKDIKSDTTILNTPKPLEGVWWLSPDDIHALFYILGDSLYYTEEQESPYFISVEKNNLIMSRDSSDFSFEIKKLSKDSLILYDKSLGEFTRLYRAKP